MLLVNPPLPGYSVQTYPPLGLGYLASALSGLGLPVSIIDYQLHPYSESGFRELCRNQRVIGFTSVTMTWPMTVHLGRIAREEGCRTVAGGPHISAVPTVAAQDMDVVVRSEADVIAGDVFTALEEGIDVAGMVGTVVCRNGEVIDGGLPPLPDCLDALPPPDRNKLDLTGYRMRTNDTSVITSRGCPYNCQFCGVSVVSRRQVRLHSTARVLNELESVVMEYGFGRVTFFDDTFTLYRTRTLELLSAISQSELRFDWSCETRVDLMDSALARIMADSGCHRVFFGIESGSQRVLDCIGKGIQLEQTRSAVQACRDHGISSVVSVIVGLPEDDEQSIQDTIACCTSIGADHVWYQPFTPFPGSPAARLSEGCPLALQRMDLRTPMVGTKYLTLNEVRQLYMMALLSQRKER